MYTRRKIILRSVLSYLLASIASMVYVQWPNFEGHVHVPFSSFPSSLVIAPLWPFSIVAMLPVQPMEAFAALAVFIAVFVIVFRLSRGRRASPAR